MYKMCNLYIRGKKKNHTWEQSSSSYVLGHNTFSINMKSQSCWVQSGKEANKLHSELWWLVKKKSYVTGSELHN